MGWFREVMELTGRQALPQVLSDVGRHHTQELASWTGRKEGSLVSLVRPFNGHLVTEVSKRTASEAAERQEGRYDVTQKVKVDQQGGAVGMRLDE